MKDELFTAIDERPAILKFIKQKTENFNRGGYDSLFCLMTTFQLYVENKNQIV